MMLLEDDGLTALSQIGDALDLCVERVRQLERQALRKVGLALAIERLIGRRRAEAVWLQLQGQPLPVFEAALREAREEAACRL
jgi:hypothetical protein